jgi:hypothetical protein
MAAELHVGDTNTAIVVTVRDENEGVVDLSSATVTFIFRKPDESELSVAGSLYTDGTDGKVKYVTLSGTLDQAGFWELQLRVVIGSGSWKTDIKKFQVHENL